MKGTRNIFKIGADQSPNKFYRASARRFWRLLGLVPLLAPGLRASPRLPLGDNEALTYHVSWTLLPAVGEIKVAAHAASDPDGARLLRIVSTTATRGLARLLLSFDARSESLFDLANGRLLWLGESSQKRDKSSAHSVSFDYAKSTAKYSTATNHGQSIRPLSMPPGYPTDLITCLLQARTWNLKPGDTHEALVLFEDEFYQLTIHALNYESVTTPLGTFDTLVLEPRMEKTPPKGMFKHGSTVKVWISQGVRRLPVRFQVDFKIGAGVATLVDYRPPSDRK